MRRQVLGVATFVLLALGIGVALAGLPPGGTFTDDDGNTHEGNMEAIAAAGITLGCNQRERCTVRSRTSQEHKWLHFWSEHLVFRR